METITITLNGREVSGRPAMTVLELAREAGVDIPTLCDDPNLKPYGACRVCIVENEANGTLLASCVTPIAPGMVINTVSPRVLERRRLLLKLLLASHPDSCMVCDKGNRCSLRQIAADLGVGFIDLERIPQPAVIQELNPFLERDLSKCILCARCIRADQELVVVGAIDYLHRGFSARPATLGDLPLEKSECTFCGTCLAACPTGAIMEKDKIARGTTVTSVGSVCPYCGCGCTLSLGYKANRLVRVLPTAHGANRGALCVRGSYGCDFVNSPERLKHPLKKTATGFEEISWDEALKLVAGEFGRIRDTAGPDSLAILGGSRLTNEENYLLQRLGRGLLGTNNLDNGGRLQNEASRAAFERVLGSPVATGLMTELESSPVILACGADLEASAPILSYTVKRAAKFQGRRLIIIDPRETRLGPFAQLHLRPRPGTDAALLSGLARAIVNGSWYDREKVSAISGYEEFLKGLEEYPADYVAAFTGVPEEELATAAELIGSAGRVAFIAGNSLSREANATDAVMALANLALLTGNREAVYAPQTDCNGRGAADMGVLPDYLPGYQELAARPRKIFEERWGAKLPAKPGLTALEMIAAAAGGKLKAMYIVGENPVLSFPAPTRTRKALESLEFLVVQDLFLNETAKLASVVLPAASFAEKEGTFTNFEGRVQPLNRAFESPGQALPDWEIILKLAEKMGRPMPYASPAEVMAEIKEMVPAYRVRSGAVARPAPGKASFQPVAPRAPTPSSGEYPFTLLTGASQFHQSSGTRSSRSARLGKWCPEAFLEMTESDGRAAGLSSGDRVRLISLSGELNTSVRFSHELEPGVLFIADSFPGTPVAGLFDTVLDPVSRSPALGNVRVKIEKLKADV
ncbi:MAG: molybdopterin-dependent oxidoreductase [Chloroflexota bacterium]